MLQLVKKKKKLQLRKKILPLILILSILFPLILIPKISAKAESYELGDFTYAYHDDNYQFHYISADVPFSGYSLYDGTLDYVIEKTGESHNISIASGIGASFGSFISSFARSIYNFVHNYLVIHAFIGADNWVDKSCLYGWSVSFTSVDDNYPGYETYGTAYGFRFTGILGETVDLVLDEYGRLYGSAPIGNLTFSDGQLDLADWSDTQVDDGDIYIPPFVPSFEDLPQPYFTGTTLNLTYYDNNDQEHLLQITNFERCFLDVTFSYSDRYGSSYFIGLGYDELLNSSHEFYDNGVLQSFGLTTSSFSLNTPTLGFRSYKLYGGFVYINKGNLPSYNLNYNNVSWNSSNNVLVSPNKGVFNRNIVSGSVPTLWLDSLITTPLPDPIVLPVDDPIPVSDIDPDPIDFDPDPGSDPDPVPGIDYPVPGPVPIPVPPIPPIVSGNDDLWPDLNITFDIEDSLFDLTSNLGNFDWPEFSGLIGGFTNALIWVSTIMTTLYEGSGFSVLFNVLAVFFIAAALFGLYKWWNK